MYTKRLQFTENMGPLVNPFIKVKEILTLFFLWKLLELVDKRANKENNVLAKAAGRDLSSRCKY